MGTLLQPGLGALSWGSVVRSSARKTTLQRELGEYWSPSLAITSVPIQKHNGRKIREEDTARNASTYALQRHSFCRRFQNRPQPTVGAHDCVVSSPPYGQSLARAQDDLQQLGVENRSVRFR